MKEKLKAIFRGPVVFYPLLLAAFPILFLYAHNISQTSASQVRLPLAISVAAALVLWTILTLILRSRAKAGFATVIFLVFFFSYGHIYEALETRGVFVPKHAHLLPSMLFIWGYSVYFISRAKRDFRVTTRLLNVVAVAVIAINLFNIASYEIRLAGAEAFTPAETSQQPAVNPADPGDLPDIYFIILDEYAHPDTMLEWYDYDNSEFVNGLKEKGFFIASGSETRTPSTHQVLAQILDMEYLTWIWDWDEIGGEWVPTVVPQIEVDLPSEEAYQKIADNRVVSFLRAKGYSYIYFGSWFEFGRYQQGMKNAADIYFNYYDDGSTILVTEFVHSLWKTTMLMPFYHYVAGSHYSHYSRLGVLGTLEHLRRVPDIEGPKFVFVHLMCPHTPYVFGPSGEYVAPENQANYRDKQFYLGQYIFISTEIERVVDVLLTESELDPIIILQSDHGQRPHHPGAIIGGTEWKKILNAMYLPGMDYNELSDSISPVNTFRLILNHYFEADYELLPDD